MSVVSRAVLTLLLLAVYLQAGTVVNHTLSNVTAPVAMLYLGSWIFRLWDHPILERLRGRLSPTLVKKLSRVFCPEFSWRKIPAQQCREEYRNLLEHRVGCKFMIVTIKVTDKKKRGLDAVQAMLSKERVANGYLAGAYYHSGEYVAIVTEKSMDQNEFWSKLGIKFRPKSEAKLAQLGKRLKRMLSHHRTMVFGLSTLIAQDSQGETWEFRLHTGVYKLRVIRDKSLVSLADGEGFISTVLASATAGASLKKSKRLSMTGLFPFGGVKHHFIVEDSTVLGEYDMLVLDPKEEVYCEPHMAFLGILESCHGREHGVLNLQQILNFGMTARHQGHRFVSKIAIDWLNQLRSEFREPEFLAKQLAKLNADENPRTESLKGLLRSLSDPKLGFDVLQHPALYKSLVGTMLGRVLSLPQLRIPSNGHTVGRYVSFDYSVVMESKYHPAFALLKQGECYVSGLQFPEGQTSMPVAITRDPSGDGMEFQLMTAVTSPELEEAFGKNGISIVINNYDLSSVLLLLGGADQDDCLTVYHSDYAVSFFQSVAAKLQKQIERTAAPQPPAQSETAKSVIPLEMTPMTAYQLAHKFHGTEGIGQVVNPLMVFNYLQSIGPWLKNMGHTLYLASKHMSWIAPKLSDVIDGNNKTGESVYGLSTSMERWQSDVSHVPSTLLDRLGGTDWVRERAKNGNPVRVLNSTPLEIVRKEIAQAIEEARADLRLEGKPAEGIPYVMKYDSPHKSYYGIAAKMHSIYRDVLDRRANEILDNIQIDLPTELQITHLTMAYVSLWSLVLAGRPDLANRPLETLMEHVNYLDELEGAAKSVAYQDAANAAVSYLNGYIWKDSGEAITDDQKIEVALVYYQIVHGKWMKSGKRFSDALLWSDGLADLTVKAIQKAYHSAYPPIPTPDPREEQEDYLIWCHDAGQVPSPEGFARFKASFPYGWEIGN